MKQIIPFKKELPFKTKVSEITSISLERDINIESEGIITGAFHITGDYKMNEGSINRESFSFDLPFDITLDPRYDFSTVTSDIEDFYYDVINEDTLKVNIDLLVEGEEYEVEDRKGELIDDDDEEEVMASDDNNTSIDDLLDNLDLPIKEAPVVIDEESLDKIKEEVKEEKKEEVVDKSIILNNALNSEDSYVTYHIHIVKEEETLESIASIEKVNKEVISECNDTNNLTPGMKLIIPSSSDE